MESHIHLRADSNARRSVAKEGVVGGVVLPALTVLDQSYLVRAPRFAELVNPIIADLNPGVGALLQGKLGVTTLYPSRFRTETAGLLATAQIQGRKSLPAMTRIDSNGIYTLELRRGGPLNLEDVLFGPGSHAQLAGIPLAKRSQQTSMRGGGGSLVPEDFTIIPAPISGRRESCANCIVKVGTEMTQTWFHGMEMGAAAAEAAEIVVPGVDLFAAMMVTWTVGKEAIAECGGACFSPQQEATPADTRAKDTEAAKQDALNKETERLLKNKDEEEKKKQEALAKQRNPERADRERTKEEARQDRWIRDYDAHRAVALVNPEYDGPPMACKNCTVIGEAAAIRGQGFFVDAAFQKGRVEWLDVNQMVKELRKSFKVQDAGGDRP